MGSQLPDCVFLAVQSDLTSFVLSRHEHHLMIESPHIFRSIPLVFLNEHVIVCAALEPPVLESPQNWRMKMHDGFELRGHAESTGSVHLHHHLFRNFASSTLWKPSWFPKLERRTLVFWLMLLVWSWILFMLDISMTPAHRKAHHCHCQTSHLPLLLQQALTDKAMFVPKGIFNSIKQTSAYFFFQKTAHHQQFSLKHFCCSKLEPTTPNDFMLLQYVYIYRTEGLCVQSPPHSS